MITTYVRVTLFLLMAALLEAAGFMDFLGARLETLIGAFVSSPGVVILSLITSLIVAQKIALGYGKRHESCRNQDNTSHIRRDHQRRAMEDK